MKKTPLNKSLSWKCLFFTSILFCICWHTYSQQDSLFLYELQIPQKNNSTKLLDSIVCYNPDSSPRWHKVYSYNAQGLCTKILSQDFDTWATSSHSIFIYDNRGLCIEEVYSANNVTQERYVYTHYENGNLESETYYKKLSLDTLTYVYKKHYEYNVDNTLSEIKEYGWDTDKQVWVITYKGIYTYNKVSLIENILYVYVFYDTGVQANHYREVYTYNEDYLINEKRVEFWLHHTKKWKISSLYSYYYDDTKLLKEDMEVRWNDETEQIDTLNKHVYKYHFNEDNYIREIIYYEWDSKEKCFSYVYKNIYTYDLEGNILKVDFGGIYYSYYYSLFTSSIEDETINEQIVIYPNPVIDVLTIGNKEDLIKTIRMFDVSGKQIKYFNINDSKTTLNISDLSKGFYFIHIQTHQGVTVKRFVKE